MEESTMNARRTIIEEREGQMDRKWGEK